MASQSASGLLKIVFIAHLVLSSWGMESPYLVPTGYLYYNLIFMLSLSWAISCQGSDSASMALLVNISCIVMDAFALSSWPTGGPSREHVYFGIAIANSVLRGLTAILLYRLFRDQDTEGRGISGMFGDVVGAFSEQGTASTRGGGGRKGYHNIENNDQASA